ncbi:hypothetical protein EDD17DRAFT_349700 [Pisolithus thermaeus]|nr:hypothetical protein EDD17DRAFT_349700 [Pisolithus thermaeus]
MDNPWANAWEQPLSDKLTSAQHTWASPSEPLHDQEADLGLPSWSLHDTTEWTSSVHAGNSLWSPSDVEDGTWAPSTYEKIDLSQSATVKPTPPPQEDQSEPVLAVLSPLPEVGGTANTPLSVEHSQPYSAPRPVESDVAFSENDITGSTISASKAPEADDELDTWEDPTILAGPDDEWASVWNSAPPQDKPEEIQSPDEWETARRNKEKFNRAVSPELLTAILHQCEQLSDVISPQPKAAVEPNTSNDDWRSGRTSLENMTVLSNELFPENASQLPPVQFSSTATAKALNEALKLTRYLSVSGRSPLAKLLASKGSANWQKSVISREDVVPDVTPIGWRILDKGEHRGTVEETKPKKATGGLLSFWSRRTSTALSSSDDNSEPPASGRPSIGSPVSANSSQPQVRRDLSPSKRSSTVTPAPAASQEAPSEVAVTMTTPAPSAVSRFLNRFSRTRSTNAQHSSLALSTDDLEYLSDIVPSATDADDENDATNAKGLTNMIGSSPLPQKLPPLLPPPPKQVTSSSPLTSNQRPHPQLDQSSSLVASPLLPPLIPQTNIPSVSLSPIVPAMYSPSASSFMTPVAPNTSPAVQTSTPQPSPRAQSPFTLPPPPKAPTPLSLPPLIPPLPSSPPQTPRPSTVQRLPPHASTITPSSSSRLWPECAPVLGARAKESGESDDEFSSFSAGSPYRRSHVLSDSVSIRSPESENSLDRLRSPRSSISCSLDDFDDFVTSPSQNNSGMKTPSPPPVPAKNSPSSYRRSGLPLRHSVRSSDHMRTQSLMDQANATKGVWPSPRGEGAQTPPILPPPKSDNLLDFEDIMSPSTPLFTPKPLIAGSETNPQILGQSRLPATSPIYNSPLATQAGSVHQPALSPPPSSPFQPALISSPLSLGAKPPKPMSQTTPKPMQTSGLSSQDLLFFEGL